MKRALITGITGQDGSYLTELLLEKRYEVFGIVRRSSSINRGRIDPIFERSVLARKRLHLMYGDLSDASSLNRIIRTVRPQEIYNLAAQSHVKVSFEIPEYTADVTAIGPLRILEAIREAGLKTRFYQASSSELYGRNEKGPQNEETPFQPVSPYAVAKLFGYWTTVNYRESYGLFACNGILFNHESPRRGENFVTRKITTGVARIKLGLENKLSLGNLDARRDWGYAKDYVEAMWRMLQEPKADDYVIATGRTHSVREFVEEAFRYAGLDYRKYVRIDKRHFRPLEVNYLRGDARKAGKKLGWKPKTSFKELVHLMVDADIEALRKPACRSV
ncbi:MAG: GDP-mannose 4,6-dehydratase [Candidatus Omnitrophica bacterium]|nr:GDP-mannose 4,6-dehydratase [Candidatus Omnitrophota bacterium]